MVLAFRLADPLWLFAMAWKQVLDQVQEPFGPRIKALTAALSSPCWEIDLGDRTLFCGVVMKIDGDWMDARLFKFTPYQGFCDTEESKGCKLFIPQLDSRPVNLYAGAHFTCVGACKKPKEDIRILADNAAIGARADFAPDMSWGFVHQFSGSFSGWSQAVQWLEKSEFDFGAGQQIEIDADAGIGEVWAQQDGHAILRCPISHLGNWNPSEHQGAGCGQ